MHNEVDNFPISVIDGTYYLLIPSRFPPVELYSRIASGRDEEISKLAELANPRVKEKQRLVGDANAVIDENSPRLQNWNLAPFTYPNPEGGWFFDRFTRCLEMSKDKQTALAVSVAKRERFLNRTRESPIGLDMRMLGRQVRGNFLDARSLPVELPLEERRILGRLMLERRDKSPFDGVLFKSSERPSGVRIGVLTGEVLDRATQGEHFRYSWNGARISSLYEFNSQKLAEENKIDPNVLRGKESVVAA